MTDAALIDAPAATADPFATPFMKALVLLMRAQDTHGVWEGKPDARLLDDFIVTREQRRAMPIIADPDPDVLWRLEIFHNAIGLAIEKATGIAASPMMKMSHEGFGKVLLTAGRLVVLSRHLRDVHRFGFESFEKLATEGEKFVAQAVATIGTWPDVARA
jgi:probable nitrogen fixation protein